MTREEFIKKKIKEKGMTLKDYARMIGMPYSTLLSMLAGNLGGASLDNVIRIREPLAIELEARALFIPKAFAIPLQLIHIMSTTSCFFFQKQKLIARGQTFNPGFKRNFLMS